MFLNRIYDYSPASQDELDSTSDKEDAASSPRLRRYSLEFIFTNALIALIAILFLAIAIYQMPWLSSSALMSPDSIIPSCKSPIYGIPRRILTKE
jgi:hypothetical protein